MQAVGLFEAKTHLSEYVAMAEAGGEVVIMRHKKPVAKIVPITAMPVPQKPPRFVQRTFNMGGLLVPEQNMNKLAADLEDMEFMKLNARLERQAQRRAKQQVQQPNPRQPKPASAKEKVKSREAA